MSTALYRRYRPDSFAQLIGQTHVTEPLIAALDTGRINHAYLFSGPRGCGKTTSARIMARCLNCIKGPTSEPCGECASCVELATGGAGSLDVVEIDAASHNGVDDARELRERAAFAPVRDRYKIFILDEAHMVTQQGFNALLKVVEEPPAHIKFIFATTEPEKVIGTIRSRTHHYPFRLVAPETLHSYLVQVCQSEGIAVEDGVLPLVVRAGGGSVRDTLSVMDQLIAGSVGGQVDLARATSLLGFTDIAMLDAIVEALIDKSGTRLFQSVEKAIESGHEPRRFVEDLLQRIRDLLIVGFSEEKAIGAIECSAPDEFERMLAQIKRWGIAEATRAANIANDALREMRGATSPRLLLELLCARLLLPIAKPVAASGEVDNERSGDIRTDSTRSVSSLSDDAISGGVASMSSDSGRAKISGAAAARELLYGNRGNKSQANAARNDNGLTEPASDSAATASSVPDSALASVSASKTESVAVSTSVSVSAATTEPGIAPVSVPAPQSVAVVASSVESCDEGQSDANLSAPFNDPKISELATPELSAATTHAQTKNSGKPVSPVSEGSKDGELHAQVVAKWPEILDSLSRCNKMAFLLLSQNSARAAACVNGTAIITVADVSVIPALMREDRKRIIEDVISRIVGFALCVDIVEEHQVSQVASDLKVSDDSDDNSESASVNTDGDGSQELAESTPHAVHDQPVQVQSASQIVSQSVSESTSESAPQTASQSASQSAARIAQPTVSEATRHEVPQSTAIPTDVVAVQADGVALQSISDAPKSPPITESQSIPEEELEIDDWGPVAQPGSGNVTPLRPEFAALVPGQAQMQANPQLQPQSEFITTPVTTAVSIASISEHKNTVTADSVGITDIHYRADAPDYVDSESEFPDNYGVPSLDDDDVEVSSNVGEFVVEQVFPGAKIINDKRIKE